MRRVLEKVLVIGDRDTHVSEAIHRALPGASVRSVASIFDAIAELHGERFGAVVSAVEPMERRPERAVSALRNLAGESRIVLFSDPSLEPLSKRMMDCGCDDYFITPADAGELKLIFGSTATFTPADGGGAVKPAGIRRADDDETDAHADHAADGSTPFVNMPVAELVMDALLHHPQRAVESIIEQINKRLAPPFKLMRLPADATFEPGDGQVLIEQPLRLASKHRDRLALIVTGAEDEASARHMLAQLAGLIAKAHTLDRRHAQLQKLAITDELTGLYNARYLRHFLQQILKKARVGRFPVTLLLFDIDNFKQYNDQFGHGVGDEILRQTATLMKRSCRDHDMVARISGDEFAVIFWEKEGPRQPRDPNVAPQSRIPPTPLAIANRFRRLINSQEFTALGDSGRGRLTISGGMAVYPYDATTPEALMAAADRALMFTAKKSGKDSIAIVGDE
ncbi:MAG: GGDEF domain-containing protein [Phycisphaerae bacterium]